MTGRRKSSITEVERINDGVVRVNDEAFRRMSEGTVNIAQQTAVANRATEAEKSLTVRQAVRLYKKAICYSLVMSLAVVMEGYDLAAMGSFMGYDRFRQQFGDETDPDGNPRVSAQYQAAIQNGVQVGSIIGLWANGYISEWFGYKKTMYGALALSAAFNFIHFFAQNLGMITAGSVLLGLPWGVFQTLTVTYASDITPSTIRPYLTTYINLCWVMGQLIAAGVLRGCQTIENPWAWRIPFAIQWVWVLPIAVGAFLAPESPWWLVRKGRYEEARQSLEKCTSPTDDIDFDSHSAVTLIKHTNDLESAMKTDVGYLDCLQGVDAKRTLIACVVWLTQALCGAAMMGYSVQIYREAGLSEENGLNMNVGQYAIGFFGTITSWFLMRRIGRRALYFWGLIMLFGFLMVIGGLGVISRENDGAAWALGAILLVYTYAYNCTVGPVCYALVSEVSSTRLKIKTVVLARNVYNLGSIFNNIVVPRMLSPTDWNWAGMTGFFYAGLTFVLAIFMYFMLPECKGRTYAELDVLFENKVSPRKFHKTNVNQFEGHNSEVSKEQDGNGGVRSSSSSGDEKAIDRQREVV